MKLISETTTKKVIYAFSDGEEISITELGMTAGAIKALDIKPDTHQVIQTDVALPNAFVGGAWTFDGTAYAVDNQEAVTAKEDEAMESLRTERNRLLAETDWTANSDVTMTPEMAEYRQDLRDLPANTDNVFNPVYPEKP